jgi:hypothetical protein
MQTIFWIENHKGRFLLDRQRQTQEDYIKTDIRETEDVKM